MLFRSQYSSSSLESSIMIKKERENNINKKIKIKIKIKIKKMKIKKEVMGNNKKIT